MFEYVTHPSCPSALKTLSQDEFRIAQPQFLFGSLVLDLFNYCFLID